MLQDVCYQYWPQTGSVQFREYSVDLMEEKTLKVLITRNLLSSMKGSLEITLVSKTQLHVSCSVCIHAPQTGSVHQVVQLHIATWRPDGSCSSLASVRDVIDQMCAVQRRTGNHPITVHCRCVHECGVHVFLLPLPTHNY